MLFVATFWINLYEFSTTKVQDVVTSTSVVRRESTSGDVGALIWVYGVYFPKWPLVIGKISLLHEPKDTAISE